MIGEFLIRTRSNTAKTDASQNDLYIDNFSNVESVRQSDYSVSLSNSTYSSGDIKEKVIKSRPTSMQ